MVADEREAVAEAGRVAGEHVEVLTRDPHPLLENMTNYGALPVQAGTLLCRSTAE